MSLPLRGAWIEITCFVSTFKVISSLPLRGAWIEMMNNFANWNESSTSLPLRGAWIEIPCNVFTHGEVESRSPCGERGLKF